MPVQQSWPGWPLSAWHALHPLCGSHFMREISGLAPPKRLDGAPTWLGFCLAQSRRKHVLSCFPKAPGMTVPMALAACESERAIHGARNEQRRDSDPSVPCARGPEAGTAVRPWKCSICSICSRSRHPRQARHSRIFRLAVHTSREWTGRPICPFVEHSLQARPEANDGNGHSMVFEGAVGSSAQHHDMRLTRTMIQRRRAYDTLTACSLQHASSGELANGPDMAHNLSASRERSVAQNPRRDASPASRTSRAPRAAWAARHPGTGGKTPVWREAWGRMRPTQGLLLIWIAGHPCYCQVCSSCHL